MDILSLFSSYDQSNKTMSLMEELTPFTIQHMDLVFRQNKFLKGEDVHIRPLPDVKSLF